METKFKVGDTVRVRQGETSGHCRTPAYVRGKVGSIEVVHGMFSNPESRAYGGDGNPKQVLYLVSFDQVDLWEEYHLSQKDRLFIDIYEHWLAPNRET